MSAETCIAIAIVSLGVILLISIAEHLNEDEGLDG